MEVRVPGSFCPAAAVCRSSRNSTQSDRLPEGTIVTAASRDPEQSIATRLPVEPGQKWVFELTAASLGTSRLDAILTAYDTNGKNSPPPTTATALIPSLPFTVPAGVHEIMLTVEDLLGRGGDAYGYRLEAKPRPSRFCGRDAHAFRERAGRRHGARQCLDPAPRLRRRNARALLNLPPEFIVAGGHVPVEAAAQDFREVDPGP